MTTTRNNTNTRMNRTTWLALQAAAVVLTLTPRTAFGQFNRPDLTGGRQATPLSREQLVDDIVTKTFRAKAARDAAHAGHAHDDGAVCVDLNGMSIMFDPGATPEDLTEALDGMPDEQLDAFQPQGSTWGYTSTDGSLTPGVPFTITYSFVPDGTEITTAGYGTAESNLYFQVNSTFPGNMNAFKEKVAESLNRWSEFTNITYVEVSDDGEVWGAFGAPGLRGDVRIAMMPLGSPLAVNQYPAYGGDMILDSQDIATFSNSANDFRTLRNTLMHEHGHGLGLKHNMPTNGTKLMEPYLNTNFDGPQEDDIRGAQFLYGDGLEYNDEFTNNAFIDGTLEPVADVGVITHVIEDVALERDGAVDWYGFGCDPGTPIAVRLEPIGTTYEQAPQDNPTNVSTVNAKAARNLGIKLYTRTSISNLQLQLLATLDLNEAGEGEYHPPVPYGAFGYGYMLVQVFSDDGVDDVQRYKLTISNAAIDASSDSGGSDDEPESSPDMSVFDTNTSSTVFAGTVLQFGAVNVGESANRSLVIMNNGDGELNIGNVTIAGPAAGDYGFTLLQSTIPPYSIGNMALSFSPQAAGVRQAVITIPSNDPDEPDFSFVLSGLGNQSSSPQMVVEVDGVNVPYNNTFDFGDIEVGQTATAELVVRNTGNATLNLTNVNLAGFAAADFATDLSPTAIAPNGTATATVSVTPLVEGNRDAEMHLFNNSNQGLFLVRFTANGVAPQITDCNGNGIADDEDVANGDSEDCNGNGQPDECESDSDGDGVIDDCDVCPGKDDLLDTDGDGTVNCQDAFPNDPTDGQPPAGDTNEDNENNEDDEDEDDEKELDDENSLCGTASPMPMMAGVLSLCGMGLGRRRRRA